jgi:predicted DNA-binding transcriptional regulator YafY
MSYALDAIVDTGQVPPGLGDRFLVARPTVRVLALLEILQSGGAFTVGELADRLGVDERTVRRYATHLADLGVPVHARRGRYGGYRLAPGYKLPPLMLTDDEAVAVALGLVAGRRGARASRPAAAPHQVRQVRRRPRPTDRFITVHCGLHRAATPTSPRHRCCCSSPGGRARNR